MASSLGLHVIRMLFVVAMALAEPRFRFMPLMYRPTPRLQSKRP